MWCGVGSKAFKLKKIGLYCYIKNFSFKSIIIKILEYKAKELNLYSLLYMYFLVMSLFSRNFIKNCSSYTAPNFR